MICRVVRHHIEEDGLLYSIVKNNDDSVNILYSESMYIDMKSNFHIGLMSIPLNTINNDHDLLLMENKINTLLKEAEYNGCMYKTLPHGCEALEVSSYGYHIITEYLDKEE